MGNRYLSGLALKNFRGIGEEGVLLSGFQEVNFFIGPNNSGKSTILHFVSNYLHRAEGRPNHEPWRRQYAPLDVRLGRSQDVVKFAIGVPLNEFGATLDDAFASRFSSELETLGNKLAIEGLLWLTPTHDGRALEFEIHDRGVVESALKPDRWRALWSALTGKTGGALSQHWVPESLQRVASGIRMAFPSVRFIPAIREITEKGSEFSDYSGRGLIDQLAELQNPPHNERAKRKTFDQINAFLQSVTDSSDARIEVPHDRRYILVDMDGKMLPLASLGTGIHEVVMLASFCTLVKNEIVCIEEPEIHLHPLLQRKLIRYLKQNTTNQYFVATHSASVINAVDASVFSVFSDGDTTSVSTAVQPGDRYEICRRLGYHASDLLQANSIIWVEGPSDRIYLNHWIRSVAEDLVEGIDYSIMFYGGRLLSHLSADDEDVSEFISLRRLNRNVAILIDSDKSVPQSRLNSTKQRILSELKDRVCWVTAGREIENYVPTSLMEQALRAVYPRRFESIADKGRYGRRLQFIERKAGRRKVFGDADKVKVAQEVAKLPADVNELDLLSQLQRIIEMIRNASPLNY